MLVFCFCIATLDTAVTVPFCMGDQTKVPWFNEVFNSVAIFSHQSQSMLLVFMWIIIIVRTRKSYLDDLLCLPSLEKTAGETIMCPFLIPLL